MKTKIEKKKKPTKNDEFKEITLPKDISISVDKFFDKNVITIRKNEKEIKRSVDKVITIEILEDKLRLGVEKTSKRKRKKLGSSFGHIKNILEGFNNDFEYELEICNVHFPMTVEFNKQKKEISIKNIVGEKSPRMLKVSEKVEVEIKSPKIKLRSYDLEAAGQTAANLEKISKIRNRDRNKFQDGIFITKKPGVDYS